MAYLMWGAVKNCSKKFLENKILKSISLCTIWKTHSFSFYSSSQLSTIQD